MRYPRALITDGPGEQYRTRVDLNNGPLLIHDDADLSIGSVEQSFAAGTDLTVGRRTLTMPLAILSMYGDGEVTRAQRAVARAVTQPGGWFMWQRAESSSPTWWELTAPDSGDLDWDLVRTDGREWVLKWGLKLEAEGWGVGEVQSLPMPATLPTIAALPDVPGEVPAGLRLDLAPSRSWVRCTPMVATCALPADHPGPILWEAEAFSNPNEESVVGVSAFRNGAGLQLSKSPTQWTGTAPSAPGPGRYAVWARICSKAGPMRLRLSQGVPSPAVGSWSTHALAQNEWAWIRLGDQSFPAGLDPMTLPPGTAVAPPTLTLQARGIPGTPGPYSGWLLLDAFLLVPLRVPGGAGSRILTMQYGELANVGRGLYAPRVVVDGDRRRIEHLDADGAQVYAPPPLVRGGWPRAVPGMRNWLVTLHQSAASGRTVANDDASATITASASVAPRVLTTTGA